MIFFEKDQMIVKEIYEQLFIHSQFGRIRTIAYTRTL